MAVYIVRLRDLSFVQAPPEIASLTTSQSMTPTARIAQISVLFSKSSSQESQISELFMTFNPTHRILTSQDRFQ